MFEPLPPPPSWVQALSRLLKVPVTIFVFIITSQTIMTGHDRVEPHRLGLQGTLLCNACTLAVCRSSH